MTCQGCVSGTSPRVREQVRSVYTRSCIFIAFLFVCVLGAPSIARATSVTATWNPNPEPDIAGYRLSYGTASRSYSTTLDVGQVTSYSFSVTGGSTKKIALQAYNTAGVLSSYSAELAVLVPLPSGPNISGVSPASGSPGASVTISGGNFGATKGASTISFN